MKRAAATSAQHSAENLGGAASSRSSSRGSSSSSSRSLDSSSRRNSSSRSGSSGFCHPLGTTESAPRGYKCCEAYTESTVIINGKEWIKSFQ